VPKFPPDVQEAPPYSSVAVVPPLPPKAKAAVCIPAPPNPFLAVLKFPPLDHAPTATTVLKAPAVVLNQIWPSPQNLLDLCLVVEFVFQIFLCMLS